MHNYIKYMTFEEVKYDYLSLIEKYGYPEDMTGGFVCETHMEKVILAPTKTNAKEYLIRVIRYGFQSGAFWRSELNGDISIEYCNIVNRIYQKYIMHK